MVTDREPDRATLGYERFFGLTEAPFSLAPNPRFLFESASYATALDQVAYALGRREPIVVVTGEIGSGKTLLCRTVLQRLERQTFLSVITDPLLGRDELLTQLLEDFGVVSKHRGHAIRPSRHELVQALEQFLGSLSLLEAHAVVMIDEAQHVQPDVLEQVRLLSNLGDDSGTLLQIVLVGPVELERLIAQPDMRQLAQRVTRRLRLEPLDTGEVAQYIEHRLAVARRGAGQPVRFQAFERPSGVAFTQEAVSDIARLSGGLPRIINLLCDRALEAAYRARQRRVGPSEVAEARRELGISVAPIPATPTERLVEAGSAVRAATDWTVAQPVVVERPTDARPANDEYVLDEHPPVPLEEPVSSVGVGRTKQYAALAVLLVGGAVAGWLAIRALNSAELPRQDVSSSGAPAPAAATAEPSAQPENIAPPTPGPLPSAEPAPTSAPAPTAPASEATPAPPAPLAQAAPESTAPDAAPPPTGQGFAVVAASFRTERRAASVAAQLASDGLPSFTRFRDGWHQVLVGPYPTRAQAEQAQRGLAQEHFPATDIIAVQR